MMPDRRHGTGPPAAGDRAAIRTSLDQIIRHLIPIARASEPAGRLLPEAMAILNQIAVSQSLFNWSEGLSRVLHIGKILGSSASALITGCAG